MSRPNTRSQTKKRSRKNPEDENGKKEFEALVSAAEGEISTNILEGLTFSRDGKHVKVDENLLRRLKAPSDVEIEVVRKNPFEECPIFLETMKSGSPLSMDFLEECSNLFRNNRESVKMAEMIGNIPLDWLALKNSAMLEDNWDYNTKIPGNPKVTDQARSGLCWLFSYLSTYRYPLMAKLHVEHKFEFSESYLFFYDKIERANLFLEYIWNFRYRDLQDREVKMFTSPGCHILTDGGNINYAISLAKKYGLVPKNVYGCNFNCNITDYMNETLIKVLNHMALDIFYNKDRWNRELFEVKKAAYNKTIYDLVVKFLGEPPKPKDKFTWTYKDEAGETHSMKNLTPEKFYRIVIGQEDENKMVIINDPRHPETYFSPSYSEYSINMIGGQPATYFNLPMEEFKKVVCESLKNDTAVWFACDMGKMLDSISNTSDTNRFDYDTILGINTDFDKARELDGCTSYANHAMLFNGVDTIEDKDGNVIGYNKFRVENSWGNPLSDEETPDHGFHRMFNSYVDKYVYMAVVDVKYFEEEAMQKILENTKSGNSFTYKSTDAFSSQSIREAFSRKSFSNNLKRPLKR